MQEIQPDGDLTPEEQLIAEELTVEQLAEIDEMLLSFATNQWRKVEFVVGSTMIDLPNRVAGLPDIFYASRVKHLVASGYLESQGDLDYMRYSELRLPNR